MRRKTFAGEWGWPGFFALACGAILIGIQTYLEIIGDKSANLLTWIIAAFPAMIGVLLAVMCARYVRRHNAKVDLYETRNEWQQVARPKRGEHDDFESNSDPGPYWHQ